MRHTSYLMLTFAVFAAVASAENAVDPMFQRHAGQ